MKNYKILIVALLPLFGFKCITKKMRDNFIEVENHLPINVYCVPSYNYPDTSLLFTNKERILANDSIYFVRGSSSKKLFYIDLCTSETWKRVIKADTLQVFVFDEGVIKEKSWNEIVANKLYLRRLTYNYNDIVNNGCKIVVP